MQNETPSYRVELGEAGDEIKITKFIMALYHAVGADDPVDVAKGLKTLNYCLANGAVFNVVIDATGEIVGSLGLIKADYWYSPAEFLTDRWFYIAPAHRNGIVLRMLLMEARELADQLKLRIRLFIDNAADRAPATPKKQLEIVASALRYTPSGYVMQINPEMKGAA